MQSTTESRMSNVVSAMLPGCSERSCAYCGVCSFAICGALADDERVQLDKLVRRVNFAPKEALFSQGEPATRVFNIADGVVRLYKLLPDGRRQVIGFKLPGDFLGITLFEQHNLSADAVGPVSACWFNKDAFSRFIDDKLSLLRRMNEFATRELSMAQDRMLLLGRYTADEKMASFLVNWKTRNSRLGRDSGVLPLPMSRRDIADYLGLTIETVSRTFTKFERDNIISVVPGGFRFRDEKRAEDIAAAVSSML
jgi:CRP/FNR family transcriptional regulator, anaerobic regulatory protein